MGVRWCVARTWGLAVRLWFLLYAGSIAAQAATQLPVSDENVAQPVSLDDLIQQALRRSPGLQAKRHAYEAARARVFSAWLPDDPEIGVDVEGQSRLFRFDRSDNEYSLTQTVPFPTKLFLRGTIALREADIAYQDYKEKERDVVWHVEQPYAELFLAKKILAALEELRQLLDKLAQAVQARYENNQAPQQDLLKAQIESSKLRIDVFEWQQKAHVAEAHVSHLLNRALDATYTLTDEPHHTPLSWSRADLERLAVDARPELKALTLGIQRAKTGRLLAATKWLPDVTGRIEARQFSGEGHIREYDTGLFLTVPVWSLLKGAGGEWREAERQVQQAEAAYTEMKNEVLLAIHEAYAKAQTAEYALTIYEHLILPQARQQVDVAFASYEAGRADLLPLIDAQRTLKDAQMAYFKVGADYELGLSDVRLAIGGALPRPTPQTPSLTETSR